MNRTSSALPPGVVSGLPNITPICMRIWLMKITMDFERSHDGGQLPQSLGHQSGLGTDMESTHVALDLGSWSEGGHRVYDYHVHLVCADEAVDDVQGLFACVWLGDE
jgi:hypothetical protein